MQEATCTSSSGAGEIHKDLTKAKIQHDSKDLQTIIDYLDERKPFSKNTNALRSLPSGVIAEGPVNVDSAKTVGAAIIGTMEGRSVTKHKFSKNTTGY